jgi:hypothetical protein
MFGCFSSGIESKLPLFLFSLIHKRNFSKYVSHPTAQLPFNGWYSVGPTWACLFMKWPQPLLWVKESSGKGQLLSVKVRIPQL